MTDNDIFQALIGKINLCKELNAWGTEISLGQLEDILDFVNRQKANAEGLTNAVKYLNEQLSSARAEAFEEFAERLKAVSRPHPHLNTRMVFELQIDNLVKEMKVEGGKQNESKSHG